MKALRGIGIARVFKPCRVVHQDKTDIYITVLLEFERKPSGYAQRIEFRSWAPEDIQRESELKQDAVVEFAGDVDASVMVGDRDRVYANPRVNGRIINITPPGGAS